MASVTIQKFDETLAKRLKEAEAKEILSNVLGGDTHERVPDNLYGAIRAIVEPIGGIELEPRPRQPARATVG